MAVIIGDYQYDDLVLGTCRATVVDKTKTSYANMPSSIVYNGNTYYVRNLKFCFEGCSNLVTPPSLPSEVGSMERCFFGCSSMTTPPVIPNAVNNLSYCFYGCSSMTTAPDLSPTAVLSIGTLNLNNCFNGCSSITQAPTIPNHTTNMDGCFRGTSIETAPAIPASVTTMAECFRDCTALTTPPDLTSATSVTDMIWSFRGCSSLTSPPVIPSTAQYLEGTFLYCSALETAPAIPASVIRVRSCFSGCSAIAGNIKVYNSGMSEYNSQYVFEGTSNDIYIINGAGTSAVETTWKTIASGYSNVHYEADDNQIPSLSFTATRVGGMASEVPSENGEYAFINATAIVYETYLPDGWSCNYDEGGESLTNDSVTQSPYWTRTDNDNVWTLKCWLSLGDTTKHTFTLQVADEITDENDNVKASQLSAIITQIIPKAYKLVDYYHDPNTDTEGMSIGKFATDANLFDVDMPALFRDTLSLTDGNAVIRQLFDFVYPVGSYYETSKSQAEFDPNDVWGGVWELELAGQVHVSSGTGYAVSGAETNTSDGGNKDAIVPYHNHSVTQFSTGGESSHTHSLSSHTHGTGVSGKTYFIVSAGMSNDNFSTLQSGSGRSYPQYNQDNAFAAHTGTAGPSNNTSGAGTSHSHTVGAHNTNYTPSSDNRTNANMQPYIVVNRWHRTA